MGSVFFFLFFLLTTFTVQAEELGWRPGYVDSVERERDTHYFDVNLPEPLSEERDLHERIFDQKLTKEFQSKYRERFGGSGAEAAVFLPSFNTTYSSVEGQETFYEEHSRQRQEFGEYMGRRLVEYHADNYAKNDRDLKPVYQLKERISKVNMEVSPGYKVSGKYSFSGQFFDIRLDNPYSDVKVIYDLSPDPRIMGTHASDARMYLGSELSKKTYVELNYGFIQGDTTLVWRRRLTESWQGSFLLTSAPYHELNIDWEKRFIAGVSRGY